MSTTPTVALRIVISIAMSSSIPVGLAKSMRSVRLHKYVGYRDFTVLEIRLPAKQGSEPAALELPAATSALKRKTSTLNIDDTSLDKDVLKKKPKRELNPYEVLDLQMEALLRAQCQ